MFFLFIFKDHTALLCADQIEINNFRAEKETNFVKPITKCKCSQLLHLQYQVMVALAKYEHNFL